MRVNGILVQILMHYYMFFTVITSETRVIISCMLKSRHSGVEPLLERLMRNCELHKESNSSRAAMYMCFDQVVQELIRMQILPFFQSLNDVLDGMLARVQESRFELMNAILTEQNCT